MKRFLIRKFLSGTLPVLGGLVLASLLLNLLLGHPGAPETSLLRLFD